MFAAGCRPPTVPFVTHCLNEQTTWVAVSSVSCVPSFLD
jgi:hypothetical protein